ncbi:MAG: 1-acyl-sn-glycerol-3-phosphate acyltransferase, partial [Curvibacter sp.]
MRTSRAETQVSRLRAAWRLARALAHIVAGLLTLLLRFPRLSAEQRALRVQVWSRGMLAHLGIRLQVEGEAALPGPLLLV